MCVQDKYAVAGAFGCAGFLCAVALIVFGDTGDLKHIRGTNLHLFIVSGPSAAASGYLCSGLFGQSGAWGWFLAGIGAFCSTFLGAMIGGTLLAFVFGALFAPLIVFGNLVMYPLAGIFWLVSMVVLHLYILKIKAYQKIGR